MRKQPSYLKAVGEMSPETENPAISHVGYVAYAHQRNTRPIRKQGRDSPILKNDSQLGFLMRFLTG
jgi:hypothetical protein